MQITRRMWWWSGTTALVAAAVAAAVFSSTPVEVDVATVAVGPLRVTVDEAGTTRVRGHTDVNAQVAGRWVPVGLRAGDPVRAGQLVGLLYPPPTDASMQEQARARLGAATAARSEAETRVTAAKGALDEAERTLQRLERLASGGGVSQQDIDRARTSTGSRQSEYEGARLRERAAAFELESARAVVSPFGGNRDALRVTAPVGGNVLRVFEEHERVVPPGTPLVEVGDPRALELVIPVLTVDAVRVRKGDEVRITLGTAGDTLVGSVIRVEPSAFTKLSALGVEEQRVNVIATLPPTASNVGDQYRADAQITVWSTPRAILVPSGALVREGQQWFAYVEDAGRARRRDVQLGERGRGQVEVRAGVTPGERVVVYPGDRLADGMKVRPRGS